jgi:hypothetical protein
MDPIINGRVQKTCSNCKKFVYLTVEEDENLIGCHVLCQRCDAAYYAWRVRTNGVFVDTFLKSVEARRARPMKPRAKKLHKKPSAAQRKADRAKCG